MNNKIIYILSFFFVGIYIIGNTSNWDNSLSLDSGFLKSLSHDSDSNLYKYLSIILRIILFILYLGIGLFFYDSSKNNKIIFMVINSLLVLGLFIGSTYLYNSQPDIKENIFTQLHLKPSLNNLLVVYGYKIIYILGLLYITYKTISDEKSRVLINISAILVYCLFGIIFQTFGSGLLYFTNNENNENIKWPHMMNYLDKYTDNSDFINEDDTEKKIITSKKIFSTIGSVRIIILILFSYKIADSIINKNKENLLKLDNKTVIKLFLLTTIIFILLLSFLQIFITDGCVITRTNKDKNSKIVELENILDSFKFSIQNQGGIYLHIIIIAFILGIKSISN